MRIPWIYLGQLWHALKEDGSKYRLKFVLDKKDLTPTLDDFRTIFHLPQATNNNHDRFVPATKFSEMVPFYINNLCLTLELRSQSDFKTTSLVQPWLTFCKMFSRCLTTHVTRYDQPPLQIMQMLYCFVNNIHVDYADLLWEGFHYSLKRPTTPIPYPRFTKLTKHKDSTGMKIPGWMITDKMKLTENYRMIHSTLIYTNTEKLQELKVNVPLPSSSTPSSSSPKPKLSASQHILSLLKPKTGLFKRYKSFFDELQGCYIYFFKHLKTRFMPRKKFHELSQYVQKVIEESLSKMVDTRFKEITKTQVPIYVAQGLIMERQQSQADVAKMIADAIKQECKNLHAEISSQINNAISNHIPSQVDSSFMNYMSGHILHLQQDDLPIWLTLKYKFERLHVSDTSYRPSAVRPRDQDDPHDDSHSEGENSAKRQKTSGHGTYVFGEFLHQKHSDLGNSTRFPARRVKLSIEGRRLCLDWTTMVIVSLHQKHSDLGNSTRFPARRVKISIEGAVKLLVEVYRRPHQVFSAIAWGIVRDENPISTLGDYSKPSHKRYRSTIKLPAGNNVVPLRSDTIRLVKSEFSFHELRSEDPNQHLKDFLKLVDSRNLDGSITMWEDLTTRFLDQFFPPGRTEKLRNDILMFQQHHGESLSKSWTRFKDLLEKVPHHGIDRLSPQPQALETTFEARIWDYMAGHIKRMERFENAIFKQCEGINSRMNEMFRLLKELTTSSTLKKLLVREEAKSPITKNVNSISLLKGEEERSNMMEVTPDNTKKPTVTEAKMPVMEDKTKNGAENRAENKSIKTPENKETVEAPYASQAPSSTHLSLTYPSNDLQSSINHSVYNPSSSMPHMEYSPAVHQQTEFTSLDTGLVVLVFQKGDDPIDAINQMMSFLTSVVTSRYPLTNNQLRTSSDPRQKADDLDAYDSDCDELNSAKIALMANLSHYGSDNLVEYMNESQYTTIQNSSSHALQDELILSVIEQQKTQVVNCTKINQDNKNVNEILTAELERYKNQEIILKEQNNVNKESVSYEQSVEIEKLKHTIFKHLKEKESLEQKVTLLTNDF
nr:zinc finger, CCHC-type [Tanacetum cinerariifolium]